jgi:hypothetical protein
MCYANVCFIHTSKLGAPPGPGLIGCKAIKVATRYPSTWRLSVTEKTFGTLLARMLPRRSRGGTHKFSK